MKERLSKSTPVKGAAEMPELLYALALWAVGAQNFLKKMGL